MKKHTVVEIVFTRKNGKDSVKLKAKHNGAHLIEKSSLSSDDSLELFGYANDFINKHDATNIVLKRGLLEDSFAKYLADTQQNSSIEEEKVIEGLVVDSISEQNHDLLADLQTYKMCVHDTIRHEDYESLLLQGILYNNVRQEILSLEGALANPFEMEIELPLTEKENFISAVVSLSEAERENGLEQFKVKKYNRLVVVTKTDYKLTVNFS